MSLVSATPSATSETTVESILRRFVRDVLNDENPTALEELVHPDYVHRSPEGEQRGREGLRALLGAYRKAFPDLKVEIDELTVAKETTVLEFTLCGTQRGDLLGHSPTGRSVEVHGMVRSRFRDGKIAEEWEILDQCGLLGQLGLLSNES